MVTIQPRRPNATTAERLALCDYLDGLDEAAWSAQSWCEAWTAHQVVAHLSTSTTTGLWDMIRGASRARGDFDRMEREQAVHLAADVAASELIAQIRATASSMKRTPMSSPLDPLTDIIVHGQDIARPLERPLPSCSVRVVASLDHVVTSRWYGAPKRFADLNLSGASEWDALLDDTKLYCDV